MTGNFKENLKPNKKNESISLKEELSYLVLSEIEKNPKKNPDQETLDILIKKEILTKEESEKIFNDKKKLKELIDHLLDDELIVRQEKINSEDQNKEKIKKDILLETNKKIALYIENYPLFEKCRETFSNAQNLEELFKIKEPLINIAKKIGQYSASDTPEAQKRNEAMAKQNKILLEQPAEIFKFIIDPEYVKTKRAELHNINGLYMPDKKNPDGGDGWYTKKIGNKQISTVIDTFGHGLSYSYSKLFIEKALSLTGDNDEDLFNVENFLCEIDDASGSQFQLNAAMIQIEEEKENDEESTLNIKLSGDTGFLIYRPKTDEIIIGGLDGKYQGIENMDSVIKKNFAIGTGFNQKSNFKNSTKIKISKGDEVYGFSDGCRGTIHNELKENKKNYEKIKGMSEKIKNHKHTKNTDDATWLKVR